MYHSQHNPEQNQQKSQLHRKADVGKAKGNSAGDIGNNSSVKMRGDAKYNREKDKEESEGEYRNGIWQQCKQTTEGGCNPLASLKTGKAREDMPDNRSGKNKAESENRGGIDISQKEPNREKSFAQVADKGADPAEKSTLQKGVCRSGIAVNRVLGNVFAAKQSAEQAGKQDASAKIPKQSEEQFFQHILTNFPKGKFIK